MTASSGGSGQGPVGVLTQVGIDVADLDRAAAFYSEVLGLRPRPKREDYLNFEPLPGGLVVYLQQVPEKKTSKTRVHLDVAVKNAKEALGRVEALGGRKVKEYLEEGEGWIVVTDPDDNEFCLVQAA